MNFSRCIKTATVTTNLLWGSALLYTLISVVRLNQSSPPGFYWEDCINIVLWGCVLNKDSKTSLYAGFHGEKKTQKQIEWERKSFL